MPSGLRHDSLQIHHGRIYEPYGALAALSLSGSRAREYQTAPGFAEDSAD
jgi:hypothetical protein